MDYSKLTVEDCIRKLEQERLAAVIEDGAITVFVPGVKKEPISEQPL